MGAVYERYLAEQAAAQASETPLQRAFREQTEAANKAAAPAPGPDRLPRLRADRLAPPPAPSGVKQGLLARSVNAIGAMADNPIGTAAGIVTAPVHTLKTAGGFLGQTAAELTLPPDLQNLAYQDPTRITEREGAFSAAQLATLGAARFVPKPAMVPFGAAAGAAFSPDDPAVGAVLGAAGIAVPKTIAGAYARSASGKAAAAEAATTAARRQRNALGETPIGPTRRVPKEEITPDRLDRISYRPDPLAEHVVQPEVPRVPIAPESFPLGTTAEGSGPMFRLRKTAFATGQGIRRPKGTTPEPTPAAPTPLQAAFEQAKAQEAAPTPRRRRSDPVPAFEELSAGQQAVVEGVRSRPLGAAEPIVATPAELAKANELIAKGRRSTDPKASAVVHEETGLPLNDDGTVTLYHHTSRQNAEAIRSSKTLRSAGEPDVYLTTEKEPTTGYGDTVVEVRVRPDKLMIDDEFPSGRRDYRIDTGKPGGGIAVGVAEPPPVIGEPVSVGRDPKEPSRIPAATELPKLIRPAQGKTGPGQYLDKATTAAMETPLPTVEPLTPAVREAVAKGPKNAGPKALYERLSDEALEAEYRALSKKQGEEQAAATAPIWTEERNAEWVAAAENRRRGDFRQQGTKQETIGGRDWNREELLGQPVHTFESQAAEQRVTARQKHLDAIERELTNRGRDPFEALQREMVEKAEPTVAPKTESKLTSEGYPAEWDMIDAGKQPREFLNFAKFGLDQTTEARLRTNVERLRAEGKADKGYQSFADQQAMADNFAREVLSGNRLDLDQTKVKNLSGAEIVGLRRVVGENTRIMEGISQAIESGQLTAAEVAEASTMLDRVSKSTNEALSTIVRETAQTARDLGFLRQMAKLSTDPEVWIVRAKKMLGDRVMPDKVMIEIRRLAREAADACS